MDGFLWNSRKYGLQYLRKTPLPHGGHSTCSPRFHMQTIGLNPTTQLNPYFMDWDKWKLKHILVLFYIEIYNGHTFFPSLYIAMETLFVAVRWFLPKGSQTSLLKCISLRNNFIFELHCFWLQTSLLKCISLRNKFIFEIWWNHLVRSVWWMRKHLMTVGLCSL